MALINHLDKLHPHYAQEEPQAPSQEEPRFSAPTGERIWERTSSPATLAPSYWESLYAQALERLLRGPAEPLRDLPHLEGAPDDE